MSSIRTLAALVALAACNSPAAPRDPGGSMSPKIPSPTLRWTTHSPTPGLTVALLDGAPTSVGGDARAGDVVSGDRPVRVGVRYGADATLAAWRDGILANPGAVAGAEAPATVCGRPARKVEVTTPTRPATQVVDNHGSARREAHPDETFVAVGFHHRELPVVAYYVVETARRAALAGDEAHFFAALTCQ